MFYILSAHSLEQVQNVAKLVNLYLDEQPFKSPAKDFFESANCGLCVSNVNILKIEVVSLTVLSQLYKYFLLRKCIIRFYFQTSFGFK